jgi:hypothetical protein
MTLLTTAAAQLADENAKHPIRCDYHEITECEMDK